jgi:hypothetical protein
VIAYNTRGVYNVTLTTTNAAGSSLPVTRSSYIVVENGVGLEDNSEIAGLKIYPNPTKGQINVDLDLNAGEQVSIELYDLSGRKLADLLSTQAKGGVQTWNFDLNNTVMVSQTLVVRISVDGTIVHRSVQFVK